MIKFKKIAAFALAAATAVSAVSLTAFADDTAKEIMGTFLNENGEYQTVYVEDVKAGNDTYTLFDGAEITFTIGGESDKEIKSNSSRASSKYSATSAPGYNSSVYSIDNAAYEGSASVGSGKILYSNRILDNGDSSTIQLMAAPQEESLKNTVYMVYRYTSETKSTRYFSLNGESTTCSVQVSSMPSDGRLYVSITNNTSSTIDPYITINGR